jgi:hypothetical protein
MGMLNDDIPLTDATDDNLEWHSDCGDSDDAKLLLLIENLCLKIIGISPG